MAEVEGDKFIFYQGDDQDLEFSVTSKGLPYDLSGGSAVLTYQKAGGDLIDKACTIDTTTVLAVFTHDETKESDYCGRYKFQLVCKNADSKQVMTKEGYIQILPTLNPYSVTPEPEVPEV